MSSALSESIIEKREREEEQQPEKDCKKLKVEEDSAERDFGARKASLKRREVEMYVEKYLSSVLDVSLQNTEQWSKNCYFISLVDGAGQEMVNSDNDGKTMVVDGFNLLSLNHLALAAIDNNIREIEHPTEGTIHLECAVLNWFSDPADLEEDDCEDCFEQNWDTYGYLHGYPREKKAGEDCKVIRGTV